MSALRTNSGGVPVSEYEKLKKLYVGQQKKVGYWYSYPSGLEAFGSKHLTGSNTSQKAYVFKPAQKMKVQMVIALYNTSQSYDVYPVLFDFTAIADSITNATYNKTHLLDYLGGQQSLVMTQPYMFTLEPDHYYGFGYNWSSGDYFSDNYARCFVWQVLE